MLKPKIENDSRIFTLLALLTAGLTVGLIVFGAIVRVTDSGLGCGNDWPLCNGTVFPPLDNVTAWIEWLHRLFALLIGLMGLATLAVAWRKYRGDHRLVLQFTGLAALLFIIQSLLGALVVIMDLPPTFVTIHLGVAMLLLGALLVAAIYSWHQPTFSSSSDYVTRLIYINIGFSFLIILTGALVRGSGATLACTEWPLCNGGTILPFERGQLAVIHMLHRWSVLAFGFTLIMLVWQVYRTRSDSVVRKLAVWSFVAYLSQAGVGGLFVLSVAGPEWGALHIGLAATTWGLLVVLGVIETMNNQAETLQDNQEWKPQSEVIAP